MFFSHRIRHDLIDIESFKMVGQIAKDIFHSPRGVQDDPDLFPAHFGLKSAAGISEHVLFDFKSMGGGYSIKNYSLGSFFQMIYLFRHLFVEISFEKNYFLVD